MGGAEWGGDGGHSCCEEQRGSVILCACIDL